MFIDQIKLQITAGKGGNGVVAWTRRKYIPKGGPCGGDGGKGGDIYIEVDTNALSLEWFWNKHHIEAENGGSGGADHRHGRKGKDLVLKVPSGTQVFDQHTNVLLADMTDKNHRVLLCRGGKGGYGNDHFKSSTNRAPAEWTPGLEGESKQLLLELKLIADVGLVGFPNAGKSSLLKQITHAPVKIASYPFTTLSPNLGYVRFEDYKHLIMADVPGIIEGAHENRGLGLEFLRHIERTKALLFVLDASATDGRDPADDYQILLNELKSYNPELIKRPCIIALNKIDLEESEAFIDDFYKKNLVSKEFVVEVSAQTGEGVKKLLDLLTPFSHL